jgi:hypothetical protein
MTMIIRLLAYPPGELTPSISPASTVPRISCLLQASSLPEGQALDVRIQGRALVGSRDQEQQMFSWQCAKGEAIRVTLYARSKRGREWLGCWNGEAALLHAGSLPVQVTFAGHPQPEVDPAEIVPWLSAAEHNGHSSSLSEGEDLVVLTSAEHIAHLSADQARTRHEDQAPSAQGSEQDGPGIEPSASEEISAPGIEAPEGTQLATWHADSSSNAALEALSRLLARMPQKTLLVDLRQHPRKTRFLESDPLSKQVLRQTFGARYWDRGWSIRTIQRLVGTENGVRLSAVITNPGDPDGLPLLVERLGRGYSLVLMDRIASYEESARAAVVAELQRQVRNLTTGPLA